MNTTHLKEKIAHVVQSKLFHGIIYGILITIIAAAIFQAGVMVGFKQASFGKDFDDHYTENFGPSHQLLGESHLPNPNGAIGKIISVTLPTFSVEEPNNIEKSVVITDDTITRLMHASADPSTLTPGTFVVVIGDPNAQGQIVAKFIRIIPAPPTQP